MQTHRFAAVALAAFLAACGGGGGGGGSAEIALIPSVSAAEASTRPDSVAEAPTPSASPAEAPTQPASAAEAPTPSIARAEAVAATTTEPEQSFSKIGVGHRGYPAKAPEETLASYAAAVDAGANWVETDVYLTSDEQLVLMHDNTLVRTTDAKVVFPARSPWNISAFTLAEIRQLDAGSWFSPTFAGERVPTLGELLDFLKPRGVGLYLEIKSGGATMAKVAAELEAKGWVARGEAKQPLVVLAFNTDVLKHYRTLHPRVPISVLLASAPTAQQMTDFAVFADSITVPLGAVGDPILTGSSPLLVNLGVYTVNGSDKMAKAIASPARVIITDEIKVLQQKLTAP